MILEYFHLLKFIYSFQIHSTTKESGHLFNSNYINTNSIDGKCHIIMTVASWVRINIEVCSRKKKNTFFIIFPYFTCCPFLFITFIFLLSLSLFSVLSLVLRHLYLLLLQSALLCPIPLTLLPPPFLIILTAPFSILSSLSPTSLFFLFFSIL